MSLDRYINGLVKRISEFTNRVSEIEEQKKKKAVPLVSLFNKEFDSVGFQGVIDAQLNLLSEVDQELSLYHADAAKLDGLLSEHRLHDETSRNLLQNVGSALLKTHSALPRLKEILIKERGSSDRKTLKGLYKEETRIIEEITGYYRGLSEIGLRYSRDINDTELFRSWNKMKKGLRIAFYLLSLSLATINVMAFENARVDNKMVNVKNTTIALPKFDRYEKVVLFRDGFVSNLVDASIKVDKTFSVGVATVYSDEREGLETASGAIFRQNEVSCAVPKGSRLFNKNNEEPVRLLITNLENNRSIIAPVLDIGDFGYNERRRKYNRYKTVKGMEGIRLVDLSERAYKELTGEKKVWNNNKALRVSITPLKN